MIDPIFRQQALDAASTKWAGSIVLACPLPVRVASSAAAAIGLAIALLLTFGEYTRKVSVSGQIVPSAGSIKAVTSQFGRITRRHVQDGANVRLGQPLFELTAERAGSGGGVDERIGVLLDERRSELLASGRLQTEDLMQRAGALALRRRSIEADIANRKMRVALQAVQVQSANNKLDRNKALAKKGFLSPALLGDTKDAVTEQVARRAALESEVMTVQRELLQVQDDEQAIGNKIKLIKSQEAQQIASLGQEAAEHDGRNHMLVLAPATGIVTAMAFETGQSVTAGTSLATILPAGSVLEAHLMVPSRAVGFIEPGQKVLLRLSAFAYQKFGQVEGIVALVERSPIAEPQAGQNSEPMYRVTIRLATQAVSAYGRTQQFKAGMTLEADILQDRRRLIEWVIDPLISAAKGRAG